MRIIGLAGWSGSGKTTLLTRAIPRIVARGLSVSTLKHAHHDFDVDKPGKDSHAHRTAGATEVLVGSDRRWALMHELREQREPTLAALLHKLSPVDLVIVEGYKREPHPKLEVHRAAVGGTLLAPEDASIVAIASDAPLPGERAGDRPRRRRPHRRGAHQPCRPARGGHGAGGASLMAQLTDDCFAFSGPLLPLAEAERLIRDRVVPVVEVETVSLGTALGRVVAHDVVAPIDLPPFDNSAVDGYAVRHADLAGKGDTRLPVTERVTAGRSAAHALKAGEAVRIFTGAPMPAGADTVFMQEDVTREGAEVTVPIGLERRRQPPACRRGSARRVGDASGRSAARRRAHVALAAAVGLTALPVRRRVRVAVFSTGDEIVEPGAPRPPAALFDANRYLLAGLLERLGR